MDKNNQEEDFQKNNTGCDTKDRLNKRQQKRNLTQSCQSYSGATLKTVILLSPGVDERGNRVPKGTAEEDKGICSSLEECRSNGCFHQTSMAFPD